jgi:hypothetical protein
MAIEHIGDNVKEHAGNLEEVPERQAFSRVDGGKCRNQTDGVSVSGCANSGMWRKIAECPGALGQWVLSDQLHIVYTERCNKLHFLTPQNVPLSQNRCIDQIRNSVEC